MADRYAHSQGIDNILVSTLETQCAVSALVDKRMKLEEETRTKNENLRVYSEHKRMIDDQAESYSYRIDAKEDRERVSQTQLSGGRKEAEEVRALLEVEKGEHLGVLSAYEEKMAALSKKFQAGPDHYTKRSQLTADLKDLKLMSKHIEQELGDIRHELAKVATEISDITPSTSIVAGKAIADGNMPPTIKLLVEQLKLECITYESESKTVKNNATNLEKMAGGLEREVDNLRTKITTGTK